MRQYLASLHQRPEKHKKRFAFAVSASFTFLIFAIWMAVNFAVPEPTPASANRAVEESSPISSLMRALGTGFRALTGGASEVKEELEAVNIQSGFEEMRDNTLNNYGR